MYIVKVKLETYLFNGYFDSRDDALVCFDNLVAKGFEVSFSYREKK